MRVILDTNVWISILLSPAPLSTNRLIEQAFLERRFTSIVPKEMIAEIRGATSTRAWLASRISPDAVEALVAMFRERAEIVGGFEESRDPILRDVKDDYLILTARRHNVDIIVSGDKDVLAHTGQEAFSILTPPAFVAALAALME